MGVMEIIAARRKQWQEGELETNGLSLVPMLHTVMLYLNSW